MRNKLGFTLLEVLVAMAITAIIGVMAYTGLSAATAAFEVSKQHMDKLNRLNLMYSVFSRDLQQLAPRSIVDEFGDEQAAMEGDDAKTIVLSITKHGWINALHKPRSEMQRVDYRVEDEKLYRKAWYVLDRVGDQEGDEVLLIDGVKNFKIRFLDDSGRGDFGGDWQKKWPLLDIKNDTNKLLPQAIEVIIDFEGWGEIRRVYDIAS